MKLTILLCFLLGTLSVSSRGEDQPKPISIAFGAGFNYPIRPLEFKYYWNRGTSYQVGVSRNFQRVSLVTILYAATNGFDPQSWLARDSNTVSYQMRENNAAAVHFSLSENLVYHLPTRKKVTTAIDFGVGFFYVTGGEAAAVRDTAANSPTVVQKSFARSGFQMNLGFTVRFKIKDDYAFFVMVREVFAFTNPVTYRHVPWTIGFEF